MAHFIFPVCECGARKVLGFGPGAAGHSHWCPWSPYQVVVPMYCESPTCFGTTAVAAWGNIEVATGAIHFYCQTCWDGFTPEGRALFQRHWAVIPTPSG